MWTPELHLVDGRHFNLTGTSKKVHAEVHALVADCPGFLVYIINGALRVVAVYERGATQSEWIWVEGHDHPVLGAILVGGVRKNPANIYAGL